VLLKSKIQYILKIQLLKYQILGTGGHSRPKNLKFLFVVLEVQNIPLKANEFLKDSCFNQCKILKTER